MVDKGMGVSGLVRRSDNVKVVKTGWLVVFSFLLSSTKTSGSVHKPER
jgi:hypothetical protein